MLHRLIMREFFFFCRLGVGVGVDTSSQLCKSQQVDPHQLKGGPKKPTHQVDSTKSQAT